MGGRFVWVDGWVVCTHTHRVQSNTYTADAMLQARRDGIFKAKCQTELRRRASVLSRLHESQNREHQENELECNQARAVRLKEIKQMEGAELFEVSKQNASILATRDGLGAMKGRDGVQGTARWRDRQARHV